MIKKIFKNRGFTLPTVLLLSLFVITVISSLFSSTYASYNISFQDYYQRLANEAAEAGASYASSCLVLSGHSQTWGPAKSLPNLSPNTDCKGTSNFATDSYVYNNGKIRTYFSVGDLDSSDANSAQISVTGYADVIRPGGIDTYRSILKKVATWNTNTTTMSVAGTNRTCAIVGGIVYCWGQNRYGQLGNGQYLEQNAASYGSDPAPGYDSLTPVQVVRAPGVMAGKTIVKVFAEAWHSCALSSDGQMFCWGANFHGQLGNGSYNDSAVPVKVGGALAGQVITDIGGSMNTSCAIANQKIYCWGWNYYGQTGIGNTTMDVTNPTLVLTAATATNLPSTYQATALSTSGTQSASMCAIANSKAYCWGQNNIGQLGDGTYTDKSLPTKVYDAGVLSGKTVTTISQDGFNYSTDRSQYPYVHACVTASGSAYCWGENSWSQIGNYNYTISGYYNSTIPITVDSTDTLYGAVVKDVEVGLGHSCALTNNGVSCWGRNTQGQDGSSVGGYSYWYDPHAVDQLPGGLTSSNVTAIGAGAHRGCAIITTGRSFCWGLNDYGQIGDGTTISRFQPTEALFLRPPDNQFVF